MIYRVSYEIIIIAPDPVTAARDVYNILNDPHNTDLIFRVADLEDKTDYMVDLMEFEGE